MEERQVCTWRTPKGSEVRFEFRFRPETTDWNTITACLNDDEYWLGGLDNLEGVALDIGSHLGTVAIALLVDHPKLRAVAVEPVPGNVELIERNAAHNNVSDRLTIVQAAAGGPEGGSTTTIAWNWRREGEPHWAGHRYIGGLCGAQSDHNIPHDEITVPVVSIADLCDGDVAFCKIDCEGAEREFLDDPSVSRLQVIAGEYHPPRCAPEDLHTLLDPTHELTVWTPGPGHFYATRKTCA